MEFEQIKNSVSGAFPAVSLSWSEFRGQLRLGINASAVKQILSYLRTLGFDMLIDETAVDLLEYPDARDRFEVVYCLLSTETATRIIVKTWLNEPDLELPSVCDLWQSANWMEREIFDMFGIRFDGHPNLKRLLLPEQFTAFPMRRDYPVKGRGERHNFPVYTRAQS